jgi:hypothetical protein
VNVKEKEFKEAVEINDPDNYGLIQYFLFAVHVCSQNDLPSSLETTGKGNYDDFDAKFDETFLNPSHPPPTEKKVKIETEVEPAMIQVN